MNFNNSRLVDHKPMKSGTFVPYSHVPFCNHSKIINKLFQTRMKFRNKIYPAFLFPFSIFNQPCSSVQKWRHILISLNISPTEDGLAKKNIIDTFLKFVRIILNKLNDGM